MSKTHLNENFQKCLYSAIKIIINRHTDYREICIFFHNIIYQKDAIYINANFRSIGFTLLISQQKKGTRTLTSEILPVLAFHQKNRETDDCLRSYFFSWWSNISGRVSLESEYN